uniref:G-protein coupled receptor family C group 6 member A n=1 Tax=Callorhinchus milii TaxID=7868 RepID=A0A4W3HPS4_CALMI
MASFGVVKQSFQYLNGSGACWIWQDIMLHKSELSQRLSLGVTAKKLKELTLLPLHMAWPWAPPLLNTPSLPTINLSYLLLIFRFDVRGFVRTLAMIHSIEMVNNSTLLPGVKLGYEIYDTCAEATVAMRAALRFLSNSSSNCVQVQCNYTDYLPTVKAVVGSSLSEVSIAVARILSLYLMPQISYSSSAEILSDKTRFPAFLRTIPSDYYQTKAMAKLVHISQWNWVGTISSDDDYGRSGIDNFIADAENLGVCIAFREVIPSYSSDKVTNDRIKRIVNTVVNQSSVNVIIVFAKGSHVINLFKELSVHNVNKTWIASDSWSTNRNVTHLETIHKIGNIVGFTFKSRNLSKFENYVKTLPINSAAGNTFLEDYHWLRSICFIRHSNIHWSVIALAHALRNLLKCNEERCQKSFDFAPWMVSFLHEKFQFDSSGEFISGYDIVMWKSVNGKMEFNHTVAEYNIQEDNFTIKDKITSECSKHCQPGEIKQSSQGQHTCCYNCVRCNNNTFSNTTDAQMCFVCLEDEWAPIKSAKCYKKVFSFLDWTDGFAIVLLAFAAFGIVLIIVIAVIFIKYMDTPSVKANGGVMCFIMLFSLLCSFASVGFFIGTPTKITCKIRQPLFGISFALCVSCALTKSFKILLAFNFNPAEQENLKHFYKPWAIKGICTGLQIVICTMWLVFDGPQPHKESKRFPKEILLECNEGSYAAFAVMLGYIAFLSLICFMFAFKSRKLPENYNEAKFITFSMLIYFISWVTFVPVYVTTQGKYLPAVEMVTILSSTYGILGCHFFPKCYIILFKKELNTTSSFLKNLYDYSLKSVTVITNSPISVNYSSRESISNSTKIINTTLASHIHFKNSNCQTSVNSNYPIFANGRTNKFYRKRIASW